jgi:hypothetical protein
LRVDVDQTLPNKMDKGQEASYMGM